MKEEREDSYGHVLKYTGIFGGVQALNILIGLVRNKVVASLLGPGGMGLASLFNTTVNFISQATNFGISFSAVRHVSELFDSGDEERVLHFVKIVRAWSLITALLGMLVCIVLGPVLSNVTFSWGDHTLHFIFLAPAVGLMAITGGETAILKGARQLRALATIQLWNVLLALIIAIPLYFFFNMSAIVPVIVLMALSAMLLTIRHSFQLYPFRLSGAKGILGEGMEMIRLGVAFILAGVFGSGAEMIIRSYLNVVGNLEIVGFYNAGFMLTVTYAGMVFSAMETDYFPRVSAVCFHRRKMRDVVNLQIEVSLLISAPMLAALIVFMPIIIPVLFTRDFLAVIAMAQVSVLSMYVKAVSLPISYLTLARGDSMAYLLIEAFDDILLVVFMVVGYTQWGLVGTGVALTASYVVDLIVIYFYTYINYGYHMSKRVMQYIAIQLPLGIAAYGVTLVDNPYIYWLSGLLLCAVSLAVSLHILHRKTSLWDSLRTKILSKFNRYD